MAELLDYSVIAMVASALVVCLTVSSLVVLNRRAVAEMARERDLRLIEKRLDEFYLPLINFFSGVGPLSKEEFSRLIMLKGYLAGPETAKALPHRVPEIIDNGLIVVGSKEELARWNAIADTVWEESGRYLREYRRLSGTYAAATSAGSPAPAEPVKPVWDFQLRTPVQIDSQIGP